MGIPDDDRLAFPQHANTGNLDDWRHGLTRREYFAAAALTGILSANSQTISVYHPDEQTELHAGIAAAAFALADAMIRKGGE